MVREVQNELTSKLKAVSAGVSAASAEHLTVPDLLELAIVPAAGLDATQAGFVMEGVAATASAIPGELTRFAVAHLAEAYEVHAPKVLASAGELVAFLQALGAAEETDSNSAAFKDLGLSFEKLKVGLELLMSCDLENIALDEWRAVKHDAVTAKYRVYTVFPKERLLSAGFSSENFPERAKRMFSEKDPDLFKMVQACVAALAADTKKLLNADPETSRRLAVKFLVPEAEAARACIETFIIAGNDRTGIGAPRLLLQFEKFGVTLALLAEGTVENFRLRFWHDVKREALDFVGLLERTRLNLHAGRCD